MQLAGSGSRRIAYVLLAALAAGTLPAFAQSPGTVKIGKETKKTVGVLTELQAGDVACHLTLKDDRGTEFSELGDFSICEKTSLLGKRVTLSYSPGHVMADECQGNPDCTKTRRVALVTAMAALGVTSADQASAQLTKVRWFGHAAFSITTPKGKVLLIDPWLKNPSNPEAKDGKDPLASVPKVDYILLTHGHRDHLGDAVEIAKKTGAILITNPELAGNLVKLVDFPAKQASTDAIMGIGGEIRIADGEVTVAMTPAVHSSSVFNPKAGATEPERAYGGNPAGFILMIKDGPTLYHSGDTAFFKDMETLGEEYTVDLALLNIGGHFGMEPRMAAKAAKSVRAKLAVPQHYDNAENATAFAAALKELQVPFYEMKPGETILFRGKLMLRE